MQLTIDLPDEILRATPKVRTEIAARKKKGDQTAVVLALLEAVADAMPRLWEIGENVEFGSEPAEPYMIDSFCNGGSRAVVASFDREDWQVVPVAELRDHVVPPMHKGGVVDPDKLHKVGEPT